MHDSLVVAFTIRRPWPKRLTRTGRYYWPSVVTVWHREPGGHDSGSVCSRRAWKWHVHHWNIQVPPLQALRRWALTRCAWCGGRSTSANRVNVSHQWDSPRGRWWQGEPGLFHDRCSLAARASQMCACEVPNMPGRVSSIGTCETCGRQAGWHLHKGWQVAQRRILHAVPEGQAPDEATYQAAIAVYKAHHTEQQA